MEYVILEQDSAEKLQKAVNEYLREGWSLQGGVAVATYGMGTWWYYQAVVRPTDESAYPDAGYTD
ncbi:MAG TPA: DUF1737 domain-containing protein [Gemmataceae bacterium]